MFVPAEKSVQIRTPMIPKTRAIILFRVSFSFKMSIAKRIVKIEFEEKIIAIRAGESAFFTPICKVVMLMHINKIPSAVVMPISFAVMCKFSFLILQTAGGIRIREPIIKRQNVIANGLTSPAISLLTGSRVTNRIAVMSE